MEFSKGSTLTLNAVTTDSGHKLLSAGTINVVGHIPQGVVPTAEQVAEFYGVKQDDKRFLTLSKAYKEDRLIFNYASKDGGAADPKNRELLGKYFGFIRWDPVASAASEVKGKPEPAAFNETAAEEALGVKPLPPVQKVSPSDEAPKTELSPKPEVPKTPAPVDVEGNIAQAITDSLFAGQEWVWNGGQLRVEAVDVAAGKVTVAYPYKHGHDNKWLKGDALGIPVFVKCLIAKKAEVAPVA